MGLPRLVRPPKSNVHSSEGNCWTLEWWTPLCTDFFLLVIERIICLGQRRDLVLSLSLWEGNKHKHHWPTWIFNSDPHYTGGMYPGCSHWCPVTGVAVLVQTLGEDKQTCTKSWFAPVQITLAWNQPKLLWGQTVALFVYIRGLHQWLPSPPHLPTAENPQCR